MDNETGSQKVSSGSGDYSGNASKEARSGWQLSRNERRWFVVGICVALIFGIILEKRTALRRVPMTDLGVFACTAWAARHGQNIYTVSDWHGWHYQYPPMLAVLFSPLSHPLPAPKPTTTGETKDGTITNEVWGYSLPGQRSFYGLHRQNLHFFWIVAIWYITSLLLVFLSAHLLACALEGSRWRNPPPIDAGRRRRWWVLRLVPLGLCLASFGTELSRGQVDVLMLAAISCAVYFAASRREFSFGLLLAVPAAIKLFPPLILLYPVWRRNWQMLTGLMVGLALALVILPASTFGLAKTVELYRDWIQVLVKPGLGQGTDTSREHELTGMASTDNQSLLAFIHDWRYINLERNKRPNNAGPGERYTVYGVGLLMLIGIAAVAGRRGEDTPRRLLLITGLLIGLGFVICPVVHNFYYLVLLPLLAGLVDYALSLKQWQKPHAMLLIALAVFMIVDIVARLPGIGPVLRDLGAPLLSLVWLMCLGAVIVWRSRGRPALSPGSTTALEVRG